MGLYINGQHLCKLVPKHQDNVNFTGQPQGALSRVSVTITPSWLKFIVRSQQDRYWIQRLSPVTLRMTFGGEHNYYPHFTDQKAEPS